ncbi:MAG: hypothetical protein RLZZ385_2154 [Pseudomonadota bacterium]
MIPEQAPCAVVIGAHGCIARAVIAQLLVADTHSRVIAISRAAQTDAFFAAKDRVTWIRTDYSEAEIAAVCDRLTALRGKVEKVIICNGILHTKAVAPEKRLEDLNSESFQAVLSVNTILPLLWLRGLLPVISGGQRCVVAVFSARIGSIGDNRRGGWYAYRASKAALNMLLKTAAIEIARRARKVKIIAFHPGTVDTPLSKPFQSTVPEGKLFTVDFAAERLLGIMNAAEVDGQLDFVDWEGKAIPW